MANEKVELTREQIIIEEKRKASEVEKKQYEKMLSEIKKLRRKVKFKIMKNKEKKYHRDIKMEEEISSLNSEREKKLNTFEVKGFLSESSLDDINKEKDLIKSNKKKKKCNEQFDKKIEQIRKYYEKKDLIDNKKVQELKEELIRLEARATIHAKK